MAPTEAEIRSLLASKSYNPSNVPQLEAYLAAQTSGEAPYIADAVRTLIKLYQLFPETANEKATSQACMLALLEYPSTDLVALTYMIPQSVMNREVCATIQTCASQLDSCQFVEFWKTFENLQNCTADPVIQQLANRSVQRLQASILDVLALSYKEAPASVVLKALNIDSIESVKALNHKAVESADGSSITFVSTADNTKRERVYQEGVNFTAITSLMNKISQ